MQVNFDLSLRAIADRRGVATFDASSSTTSPMLAEAASLRLSNGLQLLLIPIATALLLLACGDGSNAANPGSGANWSDSPNLTLLNQLPAYSGATLVREWEVTQDGEDTHVREYAVAIPTEQAVDQVTLYYRAWLLQNGWTEAQPLAAFAAYSKEQGGGTSRFIIGRIGPQLMETPPSAKSITRTTPPAGSQFFYTLEMTADWKGSPPR